MSQERLVALTTEEALARALPAMKALAKDELVPVNANAIVVATRVLGTIPQLQPYRAAVLRDLPNHPIELLDELGTYALATVQVFKATSPDLGRVDITPLVDEGAKLRKRLLAAGGSLADFGLFDHAAIAHIREGQGYIDLAGDLVALAAVFVRDWENVKNKTPATRAEVDRASVLGGQLIARVMGRERTDRPTREAIELRRRAFALMRKAYESWRRAITYLRWLEKDADQIAPPLNRNSGRRASRG